MRKAWAVAATELRLALQSRQSWLYLLAVPALVIYLAGLGASELAQRFTPIVRIDALDADRSPASQALAEALGQANPAFVLCRGDGEQPEACGLDGAPLTEALAATRLAQETASATVVIPAGFGAALAAGSRVAIEFRPGAALVGPDMVLWALRSVVAGMTGPAMAAQMSREAVATLGVTVDATVEARIQAAVQASWGPPRPVTITTELMGTNATLALGEQLLNNGFKVSAPSVAAMFVMISILGLAQTLAEERLLGLLRRIGTMPVRRGEWLAGKLAATTLLGLAQLLALLGFGALLGVDLGQAHGGILVVSAAYVLAVTAMAVVLATAAHTPQQASAYATVAWLVLVPLGGGWWPLAFVPAWLRTLGHLSPVAWYLDALNAVIFSGAGASGVAVPTAVLLLFAATCFTLGVLRLDFHHTGGDRGPGSPYFGAGTDRSG